MHVVRLSVQLQYFHLLLLLAQLVCQLLNIFSNLIFEDSVPIFRAEHNVILALVDTLEKPLESLGYDESPSGWLHAFQGGSSYPYS